MGGTSVEPSGVVKLPDGVGYWTGVNDDVSCGEWFVSGVSSVLGLFFAYRFVYFVVWFFIGTMPLSAHAETTIVHEQWWSTVVPLGVSFGAGFMSALCCCC